jgi:hypothetical protein
MTPVKEYTSVSKWQFPMLRDFCALPSGTYVPVSEAAKLDQRSFGSLYHRQSLEYRVGKGFCACGYMGMPGYWDNETGGELREAVKRYFRQARFRPATSI